jgi:hypothetical protein
VVSTTMEGKDTTHSIIGYLLLLADGDISWKSKKQCILALSSTEVEFITVAYAANDVCLVSKITPRINQ